MVVENGQNSSTLRDSDEVEVRFFPPQCDGMFLQHYRLLMWKNWLLRRRQPLYLFIEILLPFLLISVLVGLRSTRPLKQFPVCHMAAQPLPRMGFLTHLQAVVCKFNYTCSSHDPDADEKNLGILENLPNWVKEFASVFLKSGLSADVGNIIDILSLALLSESGGVQKDLARALKIISLLDEFGCSQILEFLISLESARAAGLAKFYCKMPKSGQIFLQKFILTACKGEVPIKMLHLIKSLGSSLKGISTYLYSPGNSSSSPSVSSVLGWKEKIKTISIFVCGSDAATNHFLGIPPWVIKRFTLKKKAHAAEQKATSEKVSICGPLKRLFKFTPTQPWVARLHSLLQGRVLFYPDTPFTNQIIQRANQTAEMFAQLKLMTEKWKIINNDMFPQIILNSTMSRFLKLSSAFCINNQLTDRYSREECQQVFHFLQPTKSDVKRLHWTDVTGPINQITSLVDGVLSNCVVYNRFTAFSNETLMLKRAEKLTVSGLPVIIVVFHSVPNASDESTIKFNSKVFSISMRLPTNMLDSTFKFKVLDWYWTPGPRNYASQMKTFASGVVDMQELIESAYISVLTQKNATTHNSVVSNYRLPAQMKMFPGTCHQKDPMQFILSTKLAILMVLVWVCTTMIIVRNVVSEKELRLKDFTKVIGMSNLVHWCVWFTISLMIVGAVSFFLTLLLKYGKIFPQTNGLIVFSTLICFHVALISQAFLISLFFTAANLAAMVAGIIYFTMFIPYILTLIYEFSDPNYWILALSPQMALALAFQRLSQMETAGIGAQWGNIWGTNVTYETFTLGHCLLMFLFDAVITSVSVWYFESLLPSTYGVPRKFYFPFTSEYWIEVLRVCDHRSKAIAPSSLSEPKEHVYVESDESHVLIEPDPAHLRVGVSIQGLTKTYSGKRELVVKGLWATVYENQITAFLGPNGAGKSTLVSMLTGISAPSRGTAYIYGRNIATNISDIRKFMGFCPQYNVLFDHMTVLEHLYFYGSAKGVAKDSLKSEVQRFLEHLALTEKGTIRSAQLSGGQKRCLSLAIAFMGNSKIVILDEPTSGVDPHSRRAIWKLILNLKQSRTLIITTHQMDEADVLSDRIMILSHGQLLASGSSSYLKTKFAKSYYILLEKNVKEVSSEKNLDNELFSLLQAQLKHIVFDASNPTEWIFSIPTWTTFDESIVKFFRYLEVNANFLRKKYGVLSISLRGTTLEEIVLRFLNEHLTQKADGGCKSNEIQTDAPNASEFVETYENLEHEAENVNYYTGCRRFVQQMKASLRKRIYCVQHLKRAWFIEIMLPILTLTTMLFLTSKFFYPIDMPLMPIHPWLMTNIPSKPDLRTFFHINTSFQVTDKLDDANSIRKVGEDYARHLLTHSGWTGTKCLPSSLYHFVPERMAGCENNLSLTKELASFTPDKLSVIKSITNITCACNSRATFICPEEVVRALDPPEIRLATGDYLQNLTGYNISDYLLKTTLDNTLRRYGGFEFVVATDPELVGYANLLLSDKKLIAGLLDGLFSNANLTDLGISFANFLRLNLPPTHFARIWYNNKGYVASASYLNILHNLQLRMSLPMNTTDSAPDSFGIVLNYFPLPMALNQKNARQLEKLAIDVFKALATVVSISFVPVSFVTFLIAERTSGSKRLQIISGHGRFAYWLSAFIWDLLNILIAVSLIVIIFVIFDEQSFIGHDSIVAFSALNVAFGVCLIPIMHMCTFIFRTPSLAFAVLMALNLIITLLTTVTVFMLDLSEEETPGLREANNLLKKLFLVFPQYAFSRGFYELALRHAYSLLELGSVSRTDMYSWGLLGSKIVSLITEAVFFFVCLFLIEFTEMKWPYLFSRQCTAEVDLIVSTSDPDVQEEARRIKMGSTFDVVKVFDVTKRFARQKLSAVRNLTFGVRYGECFGLLGTNGAGKTTLFNLLTTVLRADKGSIWINNFNVTYETSTVRKQLGFCPQVDALNPYLTGTQTLEFYSRIRGIPEKHIRPTVNRLIDRMLLRPFANKLVHTYSGGNLRKLSLAVAILGNPQLLLLDEPTSGMDPFARKAVQKEIKRLLQTGCSIVLTSHSMEECEILCNRLAIMIAGQFECFGSLTHLKNKFGEGFVVSLNATNKENDTVTDVVNAIISKFPTTCEVFEIMGHLVTLKIDQGTRLSKLFSQLINLKSTGLVSTYTVSRVSLDSLFVNFVRKRNDASLADTEIESSSFTICKQSFCQCRASF